MYAFRRSASRFLTARPSTFLPSTRSYISIAPLPKRAVKQTSVTLLARRWASTDEQQAAEAPISKLQPTGPEEVENAIHEDTGAPSSTPPAVAESANLTEATEETIPAAEIQEQPSLTQGITADQGTAQSGATGESEPGYGPNGFSKKPTIYIGNLFFDVTESDLVKEFTQFGTITKCKIIRDSRGLSKGFAYIDFTDTQAAEDAIKNMNMQLYEGRRMTCQFAARTSHDPSTFRFPTRQLNPPSKTLFIGNMSFEMTDRDLSNLFRGIRNVIDVRVAIDRRTGQPRGFAHADFIDVKSAMEAMKALREKETYGRRLRIDYSYSSSQAPRNAFTQDGSNNQGPASSSEPIQQS